MPEVAEFSGVGREDSHASPAILYICSWGESVALATGLPQPGRRSPSTCSSTCRIDTPPRHPENSLKILFDPGFRFC
jgi:hypothetical protein